MMSRQIPSRPVFTVLLCLIATACAPDRQLEGLTVPAEPIQAAATCRVSTAKGPAASPAFRAGVEAYSRQDFNTAILQWRSAADKGDGLAQYNLGVIFDLGLGRPVDPATAACWYRFAANQNYPPAQNNLGILYQDGRGVERNYVVAANLFQRAAERGLPHSQRHLATLLEFGWGVPRDKNEALRWVRKAVDTGHPAAQRTLGMWYDSGIVVRRNFEQALTYTRRAADQGDAEAMSNLGWFFFRDRGDTQDLNAAIRYFQQAAEMGAQTGLYNLGLAYFHGKGVEQDRERAVDLWRQAAAKGFHPAMNWLGTVYSHGWAVRRNPRQALEWFIRARDAGSVEALNNLGVMFRDGGGVVTDSSRAEAFFREADRRGHIVAAHNLAGMLEGRQGTWDRDAFDLYEKSAQRGFAHAQANVARLLETGTGVEQDNLRAYMWYTVAEKGNTGQAQFIDQHSAGRAKLLAVRGKARLAKVMSKTDIEAAINAAKFFKPKIRFGTDVVHGLSDQVGIATDMDGRWVTSGPQQPLYSEKLITPMRETAARVGSPPANTPAARPKVTAAAKLISVTVTQPKAEDSKESCRLINELKRALDRPEDCQFTQDMLDALSEQLPGVGQNVADDRPKTRALLVAVQDYSAPAGKRSWPSLEYPIRDVKRLASLLQDGFGFEITTLINPKSKDEVEAVFWDVHSSIRPMDQFLFVWSGHGIYSDWKRQGYLALAETPMNSRQENQRQFLADPKGDPYYREYLSYNDIHGFLSGIDAEVLFLVDACQSGLADADAAFRRGRTKGLSVEEKGRARIGITSSDDWGSAVPDNSPFMNSVYAYLKEIREQNVQGNDRGLWGTMKRYIESRHAANSAVPLIHRYEIPGHYPENASGFQFIPASGARRISALK